MLKEFFELALARMTPEPLQVEPDEYLPQEVYLPPAEPEAECLQLTTLTSFCEFGSDAATLESETGHNADRLWAVISDGGRVVRLLGPLQGRHKKRDCFARAQASHILSDAEIDHWHPLDAFNVMLRTRFEMSEGLERLLSITERVKGGEITEVEDDGVRQRVSVQRGIDSREWKDLPRTVNLRPYRIFREVIQPTETFLLRIRDDDGEFYARLFNADHGAWKVEGALAVFDYLSPRLATDLKVLY